MTASKNEEIIKQAIDGSLGIIEQEREREIISRRFGLFGPKETLEQIGESLMITRERVRQLEKAILIHLRIAAEDGNIPGIAAVEKLIIRNLTETGRVSRIADLSDKIYGRPTTAIEKANITFISNISAALTPFNENDSYYLATGIAEYGDERVLRSKVDEIVKVIKENKTSMTLDELDEKLDYAHPSYIAAMASLSKKLATLNGLWGLTKWPEVNPRNIRDKIYVILESNKEPMHFNDIAKAIAASDFKRKNVTTQAIHNELIKDKRFILIGRGIYALDSWGYKKGTVAEIISSVLAEAKEPLTREEIVKRVLKTRKVKESTVLLNLQDKKLFKKVDKNSYTLA